MPMQMQLEKVKKKQKIAEKIGKKNGKKVGKKVGMKNNGCDFIKMTEIRGTYQDSVLWWSISRDKPPTSPRMAFMW